jgi:hypothetical protein
MRTAGQKNMKITRVKCGACQTVKTVATAEAPSASAYPRHPPTVRAAAGASACEEARLFAARGVADGVTDA